MNKDLDTPYNKDDLTDEDDDLIIINGTLKEGKESEFHGSTCDKYDDDNRDAYKSDDDNSDWYDISLKERILQKIQKKISIKNDSNIKKHIKNDPPIKKQIKQNYKQKDLHRNLHRNLHAKYNARTIKNFFSSKQYVNAGVLKFGDAGGEKCIKKENINKYGKFDAGVSKFSDVGAFKLDDAGGKKCIKKENINKHGKFHGRIGLKKINLNKKRIKNNYSSRTIKNLLKLTNCFDDDEVCDDWDSIIDNNTRKRRRLK